MDEDITARIEASLYRRILWTLRSCARRERGYDREERRLTDPELRTWRSFAGRLHEGDLVSMLVENNAERNPLAERPLNFLTRHGRPPSSAIALLVEGGAGGFVDGREERANVDKLVSGIGCTSREFVVIHAS